MDEPHKIKTRNLGLKTGYVKGLVRLYYFSGLLLKQREVGEGKRILIQESLKIPDVRARRDVDTSIAQLARHLAGLFALTRVLNNDPVLDVVSVNFDITIGSVRDKMSSTTIPRLVEFLQDHL